MATSVIVLMLHLIICGCRAIEINPNDYFIRSEESPLQDCEESYGYNLCPNTSLLLDSVHGPQSFSQSALNQFYTEFLANNRTLFRFSSDVYLEVVQVYYYLEAASEMSIANINRLTFYSISDQNYHPRRNLPGDAIQLTSTSELTMAQFESLCVTIGSNLTTLLLVPTLTNTQLYVSEINFFTDSVSDEICDGIFSTELSMTEQPTTLSTTSDITTELDTTVADPDTFTPNSDTFMPDTDTSMPITDTLATTTNQIQDDMTDMTDEIMSQESGLSTGSLAAVIVVIIVVVIMITAVVVVIALTVLLNKKQELQARVKERMFKKAVKPQKAVESSSGVEYTSGIDSNAGVDGNADFGSGENSHTLKDGSEA